MKLWKFEIPKSKLLSIPEDELIFFVQITHLAHELYILRKSLLFSFAKKEDHEIIRRAQASQALFVARMTSGKLWEGWKVIDNLFLRNKSSKEYVKSFSVESQNNLQELKQYFSNPNLLAQVRNEFAFHYSKESFNKIKEQIREASDTEVFAVYLSKYLGNCFYEMSDTLVNESIFKSMPAADNLALAEAFLEKIQTITEGFLHFIGEYVSAFVKKYLADQYNEIEIPESPELADITIPFFASETNR